ncbi:MAG: hypothetical protein WCF85_12075 [Rhodospirillaceae bacterium]
MDELRLTLRVFTMFAVGYVIAYKLWADSAYYWLGLSLPDPMAWFINLLS